MNDTANSETVNDEATEVADATTAIGRPRSKRAAQKMLSYAIGYFCSVLAACAIMMWAVFNTWLNVLEYRQAFSAQPDVAETQDWKVAAITVLITCVVPFVVGLVLLFRALGSTKR